MDKKDKRREMADIFYAYDRLYEYLCTTGCRMAVVAFGYGNIDTVKTGRKNYEDVVGRLL